jgi:hemophore-related protein
MITARQVSRAMSGSIGVGALAGALLVGMAPSALASPPNCTAADLAGVAAGVSAATSAYLFVHPDVNDFFTSLEGTPRDTLRDSVRQYLDANPSVRTDLAGIRQPLVDLKARCGQSDDLDVPSP